MNLIAPSFKTRMRDSWHDWLRIGGRSSSSWAHLAWTAAFSATLAVGFTVLGFVLFARELSDWLDPLNWALWYGRNLGVSMCIGFTIDGLFTLARMALGTTRIVTMTSGLRAIFFISVSMLGVAIGWPIGTALVNGNLGVFQNLTPLHVLVMVAMSALTSTLIYLWFALRNREMQAEMRAADARLRLLQGQMEPHFLFNTLANVISLIDADAPRARAVLEAFTDYLRATLGSMRSGTSTLGAELELVTSFLHVMQARMGERLRIELEVDPAARAFALPPLLLQPLVENAVKHGLEPRVDGGTVRVRAERLEGGAQPRLRICVDDDGDGLAARGAGPRASNGGAGIALANLRERLQALYGGAAQLTLTPRPDGAGTQACLVVPLRPTPQPT
jgi:signal transduction histidine kinase